jgi:hypothetical protein
MAGGKWIFGRMEREGGKPFISMEDWIQKMGKSFVWLHYFRLG